MTALDRSDVLAACAAIDRHLDLRRRLLRVPGIQAAVALDGEVVWETAHGYADEPAGIELTPQHVFRIASHSKMFTATLALQQVEAGRLRLDDRLGDSLPGLPAGIAAVTVREALAHGGGVTRDGHDADHWILDRSFPDAATLLGGLDDASAVRPPNERFKYSNIAYSLVGLVIEAVTGTSYAEAADEGVLRRLGLTDTTPDLDPQRVEGYAAGHTALIHADARRTIEQIGTGAMAAATGFASTAADTARFLGALRPGDDRLLTDASKRRAHRVEWQVEGTDRKYGLGFEVIDIAGRRIVGHSGGFPGFITRSCLDPDTGLSLSVLTNCIDGPATELLTASYKLLALATGLHRGDPGHEGHEGQVDLTRFEGGFADVWGRIDVLRFGDRLWLADLAEPDPADNPAELRAESDDRLRVVGGTGFGSYGEAMRYEYDDSGRVRAVRGPGGITRRPSAAFDAWFAEQDRITLAR